MVSAFAFITGCATMDTTVREQKDEQPLEEVRTLELAPSNREVLLYKAQHYQNNRDYANALINIVRAEQAEGDEALDGKISQFKNNLIENLNSRALDETAAVEVGKGLGAPLEYMVFYTDGELIYPAFNIPVTFRVRKGTAQITGTSFTNTNGIAGCDVIKVDTLDGGEVAITASVYLDIEGEIFNIKKLERDFILYHQSIKEQTISFVIYERNIDHVAQSSTFGTQIEQFFIEEGFSVLHGINETNKELFIKATSGDEASLYAYKDKLDSRLIAFTYIESVFLSKVSEGFYFAKSKIILDIMDASTNRVVFNSVIEDVKGAGNTVERAGRKAISEATEGFIGILKQEVDNTGLNRRQ
jgi:hypothetical protein